MRARSNRVSVLALGALVVGCVDRAPPVERPKPIESSSTRSEPHDLVGETPLELDDERRRASIVALLTLWVDQLFLLELGELGAQAEPQVALRARLIEESVEPALETAVWHRTPGGWTCRGARAHVHVQVDSAGPRALIARLAPRPDAAAIALRVRLTGVESAFARSEIERAIRAQLSARGYRLTPPSGAASHEREDLADFARARGAAHALGVNVVARPSADGQQLAISYHVEASSTLDELDRVGLHLGSTWSREEGGPFGGVGDQVPTNVLDWLQRFPPRPPAGARAVLDLHASDIGHAVCDWLVFELRTTWPAEADASSATNKAERQALQLAGALPGTVDAEARVKIINSIADIGSAARPALPALARALTEDRETRVRLVTARALRRLALDGPGVVGALTLTLRSVDLDLRVAAIEALGRIGPPSASAVPALIDNLAETKHGVATAAADALGRIGAGAAEAVPALLELLGRRPLDRMTGPAARALGGIGAAAAPAVAAMIDVITTDYDPARRIPIAEALGRLGPLAVSSAPALVELLRKGHDDERRMAARALGTIGAPELAVPALLELLVPSRRTGTDFRDHGADALGAIGPAAGDAAARALLDALLEDRRDPHLRAALVSLGATSIRVLIPDLAKIPAVRDRILSDEVTRDPRVNVLIAHGADAVPALLADIDAGRAGQAHMFIIRRIGAQAIPPLVEATRSETPGLRKLALHALGQIRGPGALEALIATFQHADPATRAAAAKALGSIWPTTPEATAALEALRDGDAATEVRDAAAAALRALAGRLRR